MKCTTCGIEIQGRLHCHNCGTIRSIIYEPAPTPIPHSSTPSKYEFEKLKSERDQLLTENETLRKQVEAYELIVQGSNAECGQIRDELDVTRGKVANLEVRLESNSQAYKILEQERDTALAQLKEANRDADNCRQIIDTYSHQEDDLMSAQTELATLRKDSELLDWFELNVSTANRYIQAPLQWELANEEDGFTIIGKGVTLRTALTNAIQRTK